MINDLVRVDARNDVAELRSGDAHLGENGVRGLPVCHSGCLLKGMVAAVLVDEKLDIAGMLEY